MTYKNLLVGGAYRKLVLAAVFLNAASGTLVGQTLLVKPYLQPGNAGKLSREEKVIIWETDSVPGQFTATYSKKNAGKPESARVQRVELRLNNKTTLLYRAELKKLEFDSEYQYTVSLDGTAIRTSEFKTRTKTETTKFAVIGDFGDGSKAQLKIAAQLGQHRPDLVVTTGDNVYSRGRRAEYLKKFFPYYNDSVSLLDRIPFYMIVGNHDVRSNNLDKDPDGLAYFYYGDLPLNAPRAESTLPVEGNEDRKNAFVKSVRPRYPGMLNYSFDHGNVHFTCLDANVYVNPLDPAILAWLREDIGGSKATWKIVVYHHPPFNSSRAHYDDQYMRLLSPVLEQLKVDLVLNGHVHNYQRTLPLKFSPQISADGTQYVVSKEGRVDGTFVVDSLFNGRTDTTPEGIIYLVTGASGASLYDKAQSNNPETWKHEPASNWVAFTAKFISDEYSFTLIETKGRILTLQQISQDGKTLDSIQITK